MIISLFTANTKNLSSLSESSTCRQDLHLHASAVRMQALWFYIIYSNVVNLHANSWTAEIPQTITALLGSCVVVPCKFNYPNPGRESPHLKGIWHMRNSEQLIYHPDSSSVMEKYRGRTNLIGDLGLKNCSLRINLLEKTDNGPFIFRIEIGGFNRYSYRNNEVSIDVNDYPASPNLKVSGEVKAGTAVTASCSLFHSCPTDIPHIIWSHTGTSNVQSEEVTNGQWKVTSTLTFTATASDHKKHLICTAEYPHKTTAQKAVSLNVRYAPVRVEVEAESPVVKEGDTVELQCHSDSNPPAHKYQWYNIAWELQSEDRIYRLHNISRHTGAFVCTAINTEGHKNSTPVRITVEYAPVRVEVEPESPVVREGDTVELQCHSDSNPPAHKYQWYNIAWELLSEDRIYRLHNISRHTGAFVCTAINTEGHKNSTPVRITVEYPPMIGVKSECTAKITGVTCQCLVESSPSSTVRWILAHGMAADGSMTSTTDRNDSRAVHTLHLPLLLTDMVSCQANNIWGNQTQDLQINQRGILMAIFFPSSAASAFVLFMVILGLWKCSRQKKSVEAFQSPVSKNEDLKEKGPGKNLCAVADENIYANNPVPQFEDLDYENCFDDDIYANV
ncbi:hypothetical protein GJAV_G00005190 [Gymnothorax javanicus]|nr:hypothetical protein GJAV_G00005190 [Gymnothorax javanicus]